MGGSTKSGEDDDTLGGASDILVTEDGGTTWRPQRHISVSIKDLCFTDPRTGWAAAYGGAIYATTDAGVTWSAQRTGVETPGGKGPLFVVGAIHFANSRKGWAACREVDGTAGVVLGTEDGGATWAKLFTSNAETFRDLFFVGETEGWATLGASQYVYHTTDGGKQWEAEQIQFDQKPSLYRLGAADPLRAWAVGGGAIFVRVVE
jgi:photosystem II stability/assembly factor-like uncharacterized protein